MISQADISQFLEDSALLGTTESFLRFLSTNQTSRHLADRLRSGSLTEADLRLFVEDTLREFKPGHRFYGDKLLGLVAYLLRRRSSPFATGFLDDLSALRSREMPFGPRVARAVLNQRRTSVPATMSRKQEICQLLWAEQDRRVSWLVSRVQRGGVPAYAELSGQRVNTVSDAETHRSREDLRAA